MSENTPNPSRPKRIASHPDDPSAPFADRLMLALGIWPHHAEQAGREAVLDAAVMIRTDAHKYPMVVEDYGAQADRLDALEVIRQRVSDGWEPLRGAGRPFWSRPQDEPERMDPSVAAVLWPDPEPEETP